MKQMILAPMVVLGAGLALAGCVSPYGWSEAPLDSGHYVDSAPPVEWWGRDAASVDIFYGALSAYGSWSLHDRYGRVFLPANVGAGWQPYSRGYWRDDPRYGRRWMSSEPFGWATYHYGRWGRDSRLGWFWVPDTRFGASWVDWRAGNGYASWAPLPPYGWNRYGYGYGDGWWVNAPGYWAYRPGNSHYVRPGRPGWHNPGHNPGTRPPTRPRPDSDAVMGNYIRKQVERQNPRAVAPAPGRTQAVRPSRPADGAVARPPRPD
ncbi:DUF6600 domain-containing protein, partial [Sandaracinobacteroides sayramensis]|uniref:DUF6600 domain-containing protein n=1 Tax=Sandaracinobacteroides sayramensis TaxID=2913411 RepID=UPI00300C66F0